MFFKSCSNADNKREQTNATIAVSNLSRERFRAGYKMPPHDEPLVAIGVGVNLSARADGNEQR